jgi:hypothetical protein
VLPQFASDSRAHLVSPHHGASTPASPGLQVPSFMHSDADAMLVVNLEPGLGAGGIMVHSWASFSSLSNHYTAASGSASQTQLLEHPHPDGLLVDVLPVSEHDDDMQLMDLSHTHDHDRDLSHELVDVFVPPSP